jgi:hypothetical protein
MLQENIKESYCRVYLNKELKQKTTLFPKYKENEREAAVNT